MSGIQKLILVGHLGRDVEMRYTQSGMAIANFSVAVTEKSKGEDRTEWFNCTAFDKLAEICGQYLSKGSMVYVEGKIQTRKWEDKDGGKRESRDVLVNVMQILGGNGPNRAAGERSGARQGAGSGARPRPTPQERYERREEQAKHENRGVHPNEMDQDIPF